MTDVFFEKVYLFRMMDCSCDSKKNEKKKKLSDVSLSVGQAIHGYVFGLYIQYLTK
jgi:hypothetical protein